MANHTHSPLPWKTQERLVYSLNEAGTNRFCAWIQGGHTDDGVPTGALELEANAALIIDAVNNISQTRKELERVREKNAELVAKIKHLSGLLAMTPDSYKDFTRSYAPGIATTIEELIALTTKVRNER